MEFSKKIRNLILRPYESEKTKQNTKGIYFEVVQIDIATSFLASLCLSAGVHFFFSVVTSAARPHPVFDRFGFYVVGPISRLVVGFF